MENERLKATLAKHGVSASYQRRMNSVTKDPNLNYLLSLFIARAQASTELDEELGLLVLSAGSGAALGTALERLIS